MSRLFWDAVILFLVHSICFPFPFIFIVLCRKKELSFIFSLTKHGNWKQLMTQWDAVSDLEPLVCRLLFCWFLSSLTQPPFDVFADLFCIHVLGLALLSGVPFLGGERFFSESSWPLCKLCWTTLHVCKSHVLTDVTPESHTLKFTVWIFSVNFQLKNHSHWLHFELHSVTYSHYWSS